MPLLFSPRPSPLLLSLPSTSTSKPQSQPRLRPVHASSSPPPELLGKSALRRISEKLRSLGYLDNSAETPAPSPISKDAAGPSSPGEIFLPTPAQLPRRRVGSTLDPSWATADGEADPDARRSRRSRRGRDAGAAALPSAAELSLPRGELRRLQGIGIRLRKRLKVGKAGVTEGIVNGIHERWRNAEVVKIKCEDVWALNMSRTHEILERKTGGLVIWRSGSSIILYRGTNYKYPYFHYKERTDSSLEEESLELSGPEDEDVHSDIESAELSSDGEEDENHMQDDSSDKGSSDSLVMSYSYAEQGISGDEGKNHKKLREEDANPAVQSTNRHVFGTHPRNLDIRTTEKNNMGATTQQHTRLHKNANVDCPNEVGTRTRSSLVAGVGSLNKFRLQLPGEVKLAEEADKLLDGLGPRFSDWWGYEPLPVDADMLPAVVPGFRRPFRLLPLGVPPKLTDREMTILRRLAHPLPFHYALGRSSNLQGLALSMIKLWERCEVAKIAIKRDAPGIDGVLISEELKVLTGGTLLSRDKESIVFYRGKDFLPPAVSLAIETRRKQGSSTKNEPKSNIEESSLHEDTPELKIMSSHMHKEKISVIENTAESLNTVTQNVENRLSQAIAEKEKAEKLLEELEKASQPSNAETRETISEEERYMLRKVGLKMKQFLLLGRRGVFDGTIENMHLHWKYRELVKIICKEHSIEDVEYAARTLEAESGGILVAVEKVSKGHAIIVYRGKNYQRPSNLRPKTLLTKRDALKRSLEYQRCKSLKLHVLNLSKNIDYLKDQMKSSYYNQGMDDLGVNSRAVQPKIEEEPEVAPKCSKKEVEEYASVESERILNFTISGAPSDDTQRKFCFDEPKFDSSVIANKFMPGSSSATSSCDDLIRHNHHNSTMTSSLDGHSKSKIETNDVGERNLGVESAPHTPFRTRSLSNQERLVLRKQALKMKKRPVLSIGRNNVITGVAKTIKTHFKKHPLAIVNIKNRADGTPIQQLISELEEATGSVLVSKEINTVILYRGWGAEVAQKGSTENSTDVEEREVISSQLLEAIRLECGLLPGESE